jgi:hypothetical protein
MPIPNPEELRDEWMKTKIEISLDGLSPEMQEKALGTLHVQMANSLGREPIPQIDYLSEEDFKKIEKEKIADWWLSKLSSTQSDMREEFLRMIEEEHEYQKAVMQDVLERFEDIADDVIHIPDFDKNGALLGIKAVAEGQIPRLENLAGRLDSLKEAVLAKYNN